MVNPYEPPTTVAMAPAGALPQWIRLGYIPFAAMGLFAGFAWRNVMGITRWEVNDPDAYAPLTSALAGICYFGLIEFLASRPKQRTSSLLARFARATALSIVLVVVGLGVFGCCFVFFPGKYFFE